MFVVAAGGVVGGDATHAEVTCRHAHEGEWDWADDGEAIGHVMVCLC